MTWAKLIAIVGGASAIAAGAMALGLDIQRYSPVLSYQLDEVAGMSRANRIVILQNERANVERAIHDYKRRGEPVPQFLLRRLREIEAELKRLGG